MAAVNAASAWAQDKGTVNPKPLPPLANPNDPNIAAKELFGRKVLPAAMPVRVHGFYAHGCIAGAEGLPINGDNWQVMRLSRNRYWGHPDLVALVKRLAAKARHDARQPARRATVTGALRTGSRWSSGSLPKHARMPAGRASWSATCHSRAAGRCSPDT